MTEYGITAYGYVPKTYNIILAELEQDTRTLFGDNIDLNLWSPLGMILRVTATSIATIWQDTEAAFYASYSATAEGESLDKIGDDRGVHRNKAVKSYGEVTFAGNDGTLIPAGTSVQTVGVNAIEFITAEGANISGSTALVSITAVEPGAAGNLISSQITVMTRPISGISGVTNASPTIGGADVESDMYYRRRVLTFLEGKGKATRTSNETNILTISGVLACSVTSPDLAQLLVVVDVLGGSSYDAIVSNAIKETIAQGVVASGENAGHFIVDTTIPTYNGTFVDNETCQPSPAYIRVKNQSIQGAAMDVFTTYRNQSGDIVETSIATTIPALSRIGTTIALILNSGDTGVGDVVSVRVDESGNTGTTGDAIEFIIGVGTYPYLFVRPTQKNIDVALTMKFTLLASPDIRNRIGASITNYINTLGINKEVQFGDILQAIYVDGITGLPFIGIDNLLSMSATDGLTTISTVGESIPVGTKDKAVANSVIVT